MTPDVIIVGGGPVGERVPPRTWARVILVVGATGQVGSAVLRSLRADMTANQIKTRLTGRELDAAMDDPRWTVQ